MLKTKELHPLFGAEVLGLTARPVMDAATATELRSIIRKFGLVFVRGQSLTDTEMEDFAANLGELYRVKAVYQGRPDEMIATFPLTNLGKDGRIVPQTDRIREMNIANQLWHIDNTFTKPRAEFSFLYARRIPPRGGETQICDTRIAYETLSDEMREKIASLYGYHSFVHSRSQTGFTAWTESERNNLKSIRRPLVYTQAETGRKAVNVASHIGDIDGMTYEAAQALCKQLIAHATQPDRVYTHRWQVGDLLMWDNHCVMHRAMPFDDAGHVRDMRALRTLDLADA